MRWLAFLLVLSVAWSQELTIDRVFKDTLSNSLELKAYRHEVKALEKEYESARGLLFPNLKFEETFTRTDIPAYVLFTKLNQERVRPTDFNPSTLNDPDAVSNFETKLSVEVPIWMGGKLGAFKRASLYRREAKNKELMRMEEEVLFKAYSAFLAASLSRSAVRVALKNLEEAREHLRIAKELNEVGMALLSDVLRANVFVKNAEEKLVQARSDYRTSLKALSLTANTDYSGYDVPTLESCPHLSEEELKSRALKNREDIKALEDYAKAIREESRASVGENLPQVTAFASYSLYDRDVPLGSDGKGYMFGIRLSLDFNTGLSSLKKAESLREKERALLKRKEFMEKTVLFQVEKAYSEYEVSLKKLGSAQERVREAEEVVRIVKERYKSGLARMVDLIDAQTQLENARFDYIRALYECNLSYGKALLEAGLIKEALR